MRSNHRVRRSEDILSISDMSQCPVSEDEAPKAESACPVGAGASEKNGDNGMLGWFGRGRATGSVGPAKPSPVNSADGGYNAAANDETFDQERRAGQSVNLSTRRSLSRIPKGEYTPHHQLMGEKDEGSAKSKNWIYPSEQQYFNAMKRKGYNPKEEDVGSILAIHNVVNERSWSEIHRWESFRGNLTPRLVRFMGKPKELSPKAKFLSFIGRAPPFDRHDWVVDRDGQEVRYVIDFYEIDNHSKNTRTGANVPIHIDVRPALDSFGAAVDRVQMMFPSLFPSPGAKR